MTGICKLTKKLCQTDRQKQTNKQTNKHTHTHTQIESERARERFEAIRLACSEL